MKKQWAQSGWFATSVAVGLAMGAAAGAWLASPASSLPEKGAPPMSFDISAYEKRMKKAFGGKVMGYSTVLLKNGLVAKIVSGGKARNSADGNLNMSSTVPANIGSTIKFTGGVALLHLFESDSKTINPQGRTVSQWLDLPIYTYFPKIWQDGMHSSIRKITFRKLLQHRSGFRNLPGEDFGDDGVKRMYDYLPKGVTNADFNQREYANANISLVTYLIPMIADPSLLAKVDKEAKDKKWTAGGQEIHKRIADVWEKYMHTQIYGKITPPVDPSCNPTDEWSSGSWAPDYVSKDDKNNGATRDSRDTNGYCQAQGGWYISARDLAAFVANFNASSTLVSSSTRDLMFDDDKANERIVWSFTIADDFIEKKFNLSQLAYMGGDHGGAHASILQLPNGYYAVGIINSNDMSSGGVTRRLQRAFKTGLGAPEDPLCPALGVDLAAAKKVVEQRRADVKAAQADLQDAIADGIKGGFYTQQVKKAQAALKIALAAQKVVEDKIELRVCEY